MQTLEEFDRDADGTIDETSTSIYDAAGNKIREEQGDGNGNINHSHPISS